MKYTAFRNESKSKRKKRISQSVFARIRRKASKLAIKKHKLKKERETELRSKGLEKRLPKDKRTILEKHNPND